MVKSRRPATVACVIPATVVVAVTNAISSYSPVTVAMSTTGALPAVSAASSERVVEQPRRRRRQSPGRAGQVCDSQRSQPQELGGSRRGEHGALHGGLVPVTYALPPRCAGSRSQWRCDKPLMPPLRCCLRLVRSCAGDARVGRSASIHRAMRSGDSGRRPADFAQAATCGQRTGPLDEPDQRGVANPTTYRWPLGLEVHPRSGHESVLASAAARSGPPGGCRVLRWMRPGWTA